MRSLVLPTTPAILSTIQKHFDWAAFPYFTLQALYIPLFRSLQCDFHLLITAHDFCPFRRDKAENLLLKGFKEDGSFLLRRSREAHDGYVLSLYVAEKVRHYVVKLDAETGMYYPDSDPSKGFSDLMGLVEHYKFSAVSSLFLPVQYIINLTTSNTWLAGPREARGCDNIFYWLGTNCKITESSTKYRRQNTNRNWTTTNCTITESSTKYRR